MPVVPKPYDKLVDVMPVMPEQAIELSRVLQNGRIPATLTSNDFHTNSIDNPADIMSGKPSDNFEAMEMESQVRAAGQVQAQTTESSEEGGAAAPAPATSQE